MNTLFLLTNFRSLHYAFVYEHDLSKVFFIFEKKVTHFREERNGDTQKLVVVRNDGRKKHKVIN